MANSDDQPAAPFTSTILSEVDLPPLDRKTGPTTPKSAARLAAVLILFQLDMYPETSGEQTDENTEPEAHLLVESLINDLSLQLLENQADQDEESFMIEPDMRFLTRICGGVTEHLAALDQKITPHLKTDWKFDRLDPVHRAILRAASYELAHMPDVPAKVVINEYIDVANAFSDKNDVRFINGMLDTLARKLRPDDPAFQPHE